MLYDFPDQCASCLVVSGASVSRRGRIRLWIRVSPEMPAAEVGAGVELELGGGVELLTALSFVAHFFRVRKYTTRVDLSGALLLYLRREPRRRWRGVSVARTQAEGDFLSVYCAALQRRIRQGDRDRWLSPEDAARS